MLVLELTATNQQWDLGQVSQLPGVQVWGRVLGPTMSNECPQDHTWKAGFYLTAGSIEIHRLPWSQLY